MMFDFEIKQFCQKSSKNLSSCRPNVCAEKSLQSPIDFFLHGPEMASRFFLFMGNNCLAKHGERRHDCRDVILSEIPGHHMSMNHTAGTDHD